MMQKRSIFLFSLLLTSTAVLGLDSKEKAITENIEQNLSKDLTTLETIVNINSGTMNFEGVRQVGNVLIKQFDELEFNTKWVPGDSFNRAGHLTASYGNSGPKLLLIGHLDTVFAKNDKFQRYQKVDDNHIAGPGITDMKGGDVIIISALRALKSQGVLDQVSIKVVMTGDEESSGRPLSESKKAIIDAAKWADIALGFEDGDGDIKTAVISRRGAVGWTLDIKGKPAHSSQIFREDIGDGAIFEAARILNAFRESLSGVKNLTFNPGMIVGGTTLDYHSKESKGNAFGKSNVIAKTAKVTGDIRALSPKQLSESKKIMKKIVAQNLPHTQATIRFNDGYPPMAPTDGNSTLLSRYSRVSQDLGLGKVVAVDPRRAGAADISFAANHVKMSLDGLGLMGTGGHTKDEVADITTFSRNAKKAAILIYRLSQE